MGYNTRYKLEVVDDQGRGDMLIAALRESFEYAAFTLSPSGAPSEASSWYEHEENLREFSQNHPLCLFILSGEGEESGDIWKKYFLNGKCQKAKAEIKFAEFDPRRLK